MAAFRVGKEGIRYRRDHVAIWEGLEGQQTFPMLVRQSHRTSLLEVKHHPNSSFIPSQKAIDLSAMVTGSRPPPLEPSVSCWRLLGVPLATYLETIHLKSTTPDMFF